MFYQMTSKNRKNAKTAAWLGLQAAKKANAEMAKRQQVVAKAARSNSKV